MRLNNVRRSIGSHFRRSLISGLLLLIPVALTYVIIRFLFDLVDGFLGPWIEGSAKVPGDPKANGIFG